jgi:hypothetical protein
MEDNLESCSNLLPTFLSPIELDLEAFRPTLFRYQAIIKALTDINSSASVPSFDQFKYINDIYTHLAGFPTTPSFGFELCSSPDKLTSLEETKYDNIYSMLKKHCQDVLRLISSTPEEKRNSNIARVFFAKMQGDFYNLLAEYQEKCGERNGISVQNSERAYLLASSLAVALLNPISPVRLSVSLCYAKFLHDVKRNAENAYKVARKAFDLALEQMDYLEKKCFNDSMAIMQLLTDYINMWSMEIESNE